MQARQLFRRVLFTSPLSAARPGLHTSSSMQQPTAARNHTAERYEDSLSDKRVFAPAAGRNKQFIFEELAKFLKAPDPPSAQCAPVRMLEVASGTGEHAALIAANMPWLTVQPTDYEADLFDSIKAHSQGLPNVLQPQTLDTSQPDSWQLPSLGPTLQVDAMLCVNMTHISPYACTLGLLTGASRFLIPNGLLFIYGPFTIQGGKHTSEGNERFDKSLRAQNPEWGYRDVEEIKAQAAARGLRSEAVIPMPANNFTLVFRKSGDTS